MVDKVIESLNKNIMEVPGKFLSFTMEQVSSSPKPGKWSRKQILGHLCDSALNNYSRFIRARFEPEPVEIGQYKQDEWVEFNGYQTCPAEEIVSLWTVLNKRIVSIIAEIPQAELNNKFNMGDGEIKTLQWLIEDYLAHMEHHLGQIF